MSANDQANRPPSVVELVLESVDRIDAMLERLTLEYGPLHDHLRELNARSGPMFVSLTPYRWQALPEDGARLQSQLLQEYRRLADTIRVLLAGQPQSSAETLQKDIDTVVELIERRKSAFDTAERALQNAREALANHLVMLNARHSAADGATLLIPDTNALYWNPSLERWKAPWLGPFTVVLVPQVATEIDEHKYDDRRARRRMKAERLARQFSDYRKRGRLTDGVPLLKGTSTFLSIATEPRLSESLPWLDASNPDDRFIASALEVMRTNPRSSAVIISRDTHLLNKLEIARLPFVEPSSFIDEEDPENTNG